MSIFARNAQGLAEALRDRVVGVAGCGGLGSNAAMALARAGVGELILADFDKVEESNLNRQHYFQSDIGQEKVRALARHLRAVNPDIRLAEHVVRLSPENMRGVFSRADLLIEAFDRAQDKKWLLEAWCRAFPDRDIVCGNGVAGWGRTEALLVLQAGTHVWFCGDNESELELGLCSARVAVVANMQANVAIERLMLAAGR